jgi:hypothetical protein
MIRRVTWCMASDEGKINSVANPTRAQMKSLGRAAIKRISLGRLACKDMSVIILCYLKPSNLENRRAWPALLADRRGPDNSFKSSMRIAGGVKATRGK